jgi:hypothetical protein
LRYALPMTPEQHEVAHGCIDRIHLLWCEGTEDKYPREKITSMLEVLSALKAYDCCEHLHFMWLAYLSALDEGLERLAQYRARLFDEEFHALRESVNTSLLSA